MTETPDPRDARIAQLQEELALARQGHAGAPLDDLSLADRDRRIAETLAFMADRGYDFVAPGEAAVVVHNVEVTTDSVGAAYIRLAEGKVRATAERQAGVNIDLGHDGQVLGVELLYPALNGTEKLEQSKELLRLTIAEAEEHAAETGLESAKTYALGLRVAAVTFGMIDEGADPTLRSPDGQARLDDAVAAAFG